MEVSQTAQLLSFSNALAPLSLRLVHFHSSSSVRETLYGVEAARTMVQFREDFITFRGTLRVTISLVDIIYLKLSALSFTPCLRACITKEELV